MKVFLCRKRGLSKYNKVDVRIKIIFATLCHDGKSIDKLASNNKMWGVINYW